MRIGDERGAVGHHPGGYTVGLERLHDLPRAAHARPLGHRRVQGVGVGETGRRRGEPLVPERRRVARGRAEAPPFLVVAHGDGAPSVSAPAGIAAVGCVPVAAVPHGLRGAAVDQAVQQRRSDERRRDLALGDVDELPFPGAGAVMQGRHEHERHVDGDDVVGVGGLRTHGRAAVGVVPQPGHAGEGHQAGTPGHVVLPGAGGAESLEADHDDVRLHRLELLVAQAQTVHDPDAEVLHHHVTLGDDAARHLPALFRLEVGGHRQLVAVVVGEGQRRLHVLVALADAPGVGPGSGLDLDHLGAEVGKLHGAVRAGDHVREVGDANAFQGQRARRRGF